MLLGGPVRLTVGAEVTGYSDFHFTFVQANKKKRKEKKTLSLMGFGDKKLPAPGPSLLSLGGC